MADFLGSFADLSKRQFNYEWVLEGILPAGGVLLFHGRRGLGKSRLMLALALSVACEGRFLGRWEARRGGGGILYVQADLPPIVQRDRIVSVLDYFPWLTEDNKLRIYCPTHLDIARLEIGHEILEEQDHEPVLVIWDVLRKVHGLKEETHVPSVIYGQMKDLFPNAAHIVVHHDRKMTKDQAEGYLDEDEAFSGHGPWLDLAISAWHLVETGGQFVLDITKNNCAPFTEKNIRISMRDDNVLPYAQFGPVKETVAQWRVDNNCNPRPLSGQEILNLRRYLQGSFIASPEAIDNYIQALTASQR